MWHTLMEHFDRYPAQERVVRMLIRHGFSIHEGRIWAGDVELADSAVGRAAHVDRRIVNTTATAIEQNPDLARIFKRFLPTLYLKEVAPELRWGVIEIVPTNATKSGILAGVCSVISREGISIRQAVVDDPEFIDEPKLFITTERHVPPVLLPEIQEVDGVKSVTVY